MRNPFHPENQKDQFQFFQQVTEAINKWMLESYPGFDSTLLRNLNRCIELQKILENNVNILEKNLQVAKVDIHKYVVAKLEKTHPDFNNSISKAIIKLDKRADELDKKTKTVIKSDSLYEDVYRMKDEVKGLVQFVDGFRKKIKQACE